MAWEQVVSRVFSGFTHKRRGGEGGIENVWMEKRRIFCVLWKEIVFFSDKSSFRCRETWRKRRYSYYSNDQFFKLEMKSKKPENRRTQMRGIEMKDKPTSNPLEANPPDSTLYFPSLRHLLNEYYIELFKMEIYALKNRVIKNIPFSFLNEQSVGLK